MGSALERFDELQRVTKNPQSPSATSLLNTLSRTVYLLPVTQIKQETRMHASTEDIQWARNDIAGLIVLEGELAAVTGDDSESPQLSALVPVLSRLRNAFGMEMVFVGQLKNGRLNACEAPFEDSCNPFQEAYGRQLLEARCGCSHFGAVPVCSDQGIESGTLVCGVAAGDGYQPPPDSLKSVSRLLASTMRRMRC
jgi:hypothetical protein